jgi:hypothetical protein
MTPLVARRPCEVCIEIRMYGALNMPFGKQHPALIGITQTRPTIENAQWRTGIEHGL